MDLRDSQPLDTTLRLLFPFIVVFSVQLFSYGANSPGGGFSAGVVLATSVAVFDLLGHRNLYPTRWFVWMEVVGLALLAFLLVVGVVHSGGNLGAVPQWIGHGRLLSNITMWLLNLAVFLEVAGSIVLVVRRLMELPV